LRGAVSSVGVEDMVPSRPPVAVAVTVYWDYLMNDFDSKVNESSLEMGGHTRLSLRVRSVRRAGINVAGDKIEEVERRAGRNINALPAESRAMTRIEGWVGRVDLEVINVQFKVHGGCRHGGPAWHSLFASLSSVVSDGCKLSSLGKH